MVITSFDQVVSTEGMVYLPYNRYVCTDAHFSNTARAVMQQGGKVLAQSSFNPYEKRYSGQDLNGKNVAVYRHTAFGDQLIVTGLTNYLKFMFPRVRLFYFSSPDTFECWRNNPSIEYCGGPMPLETVKAMDYHIFLESMFESDGEPDQMNCYDSMYQFCGIDPVMVPDIYKRPRMYFNTAENKVMREITKQYGKYILFHWNSSNPNRMYPPEDSIATLQLLRKKLPYHNIIVVGALREGAEIPEIEGVYNLVNRTTTFREVVYYIARSQLVIGPDSSIMHVTGSFDNIPCISLWGLFHPDDRVKYYPNHYPITGFEMCPHAPCRNHDFKLPNTKCRDCANHIEPAEYCNALRSINPEFIVSKAGEILDKKLETSEKSK